MFIVDDSSDETVCPVKKRLKICPNYRICNIVYMNAVNYKSAVGFITRVAQKVK